MGLYGVYALGIAFLQAQFYELIFVLFSFHLIDFEFLLLSYCILCILFWGFQNLLYIRVTLESLFRHSLLMSPLRVSGLFDLAWGPRICISNKFPGDVDVASPGATLGDSLLQVWIPWNQETKEDLFAFISLYLKYLWLISQMDRKTIQIWLKKERENSIVPFLSRGLAPRWQQGPLQFLSESGQGHFSLLSFKSSSYHVNAWRNLLAVSFYPKKTKSSLQLWLKD